jgi:hypothetical protein
MFGDHIASAMARERQRDLVPELRELQPARTFRVEDGESAGGPGSERRHGAWSRIGRALARSARVASTRTQPLKKSTK